MPYEKPFGYEIVFFRIKYLFEGYVVHSALMDLNSYDFIARELLIPIVLLKKLDPKFVFRTFFNHLEFDSVENIMSIKVLFPSLSFNLRLKMKSATTLVSSKGLSSIGSSSSNCYYYSFPAMETYGAVKIRGKQYLMKGSTWHDHQWGNFPIRNIVWDWFSIRFDADELYILLFFLKETGRRKKVGSLIYKRNDFDIQNFKVVNKRVIKAKNEVIYPQDWSIEVLDCGGNVLFTCEVKSLFGDQYFNSLITPSYWEGICSAELKVISNIENLRLYAGMNFRGYAYVELFGYGV